MNSGFTAPNLSKDQVLCEAMVKTRFSADDMSKDGSFWESMVNWEFIVPNLSNVQLNSAPMVS